jgi:hypothetical protein
MGKRDVERLWGSGKPRSKGQAVEKKNRPTTPGEGEDRFFR